MSTSGQSVFTLLAAMPCVVEVLVLPEAEAKIVCCAALLLHYFCPHQNIGLRQ